MMSRHKKIFMLPVVMFSLLIMMNTAFGTDYKASAQSWQKQANDVREQVAGVAEELMGMSYEDNIAAKGLVEDALRWFERGDQSLEKADLLFENEEYDKASNSYNMAWQLYVKAATAGLNAKRILTGK